MISIVTSVKTLTLFLHMQSSILTIHDTCGNVKGVCTGGFWWVKKINETHSVHIFSVVEKGN